MTASDFRSWRERMGFGKRDAARALGCDRNAVARYDAGAANIPRYIELACLAIEYLGYAVSKALL